MRAEEIREMSESDINARIAELERERFNLKFRGATQSLEDPLRLRSIRRDIARLQTVLRERELKTKPRQSRRTRAERTTRSARTGRGAKTRGANTRTARSR